VIKYKDIIVGHSYRLGKFLTADNKPISNMVGTVVSKCSGDCGGHIIVTVAGMHHPFLNNGHYMVHLNNMKGVVTGD
jgi:chitinase